MSCPTLATIDEQERAARFFVERFGPTAGETGDRFAALFACRLFGGELRGNAGLWWCRTATGLTVDLLAHVRPPRLVRYVHDVEYWEVGPGRYVQQANESADRVVARWVKDYRRQYGLIQPNTEGA